MLRIAQGLGVDGVRRAPAPTLTIFIQGHHGVCEEKVSLRSLGRLPVDSRRYASSCHGACRIAASSHHLRDQGPRLRVRGISPGIPLETFLGDIHAPHLPDVEGRIKQVWEVDVEVVGLAVVDSDGSECVVEMKMSVGQALNERDDDGHGSLAAGAAGNMRESIERWVERWGGRERHRNTGRRDGQEKSEGGEDALSCRQSQQRIPTALFAARSGMIRREKLWIGVRDGWRKVWR